jgi:hypothetical protein
MSDELNKFYANVFTKKDITTLPKADDVQYKPGDSREKDILKKIRKLRSEAVFGSDGISPRILKEQKK